MRRLVEYLPVLVLFGCWGPEDSTLFKPDGNQSSLTGADAGTGSGSTSSGGGSTAGSGYGASAGQDTAVPSGGTTAYPVAGSGGATAGGGCAWHPDTPPATNDTAKTHSQKLTAKAPFTKAQISGLRALERGRGCHCPWRSEYGRPTCQACPVGLRLRRLLSPARGGGQSTLGSPVQIRHGAAAVT